MTRCQGTRVSAGQFLRITAPTDRAQPPATLATAPYVVTLPAGTPRTTACTLDSKAVGISLAARRRPQPRTALRDADALLQHSAASVACAGLCNHAARRQMSNARAAQRCSRQLAVPCLLGQQSEVCQLFAARDGLLGLQALGESRPKWMHGAKRSRSERRHDSSCPILPGFKCVCYAR